MVKGGFVKYGLDAWKVVGRQIAHDSRASGVVYVAEQNRLQMCCCVERIGKMLVYRGQGPSSSHVLAHTHR